MQVGFLFHEFVQSLLDVNFQHPQHPLGKSYSLCVLWKKKPYFFWTCQLLTLIFHHFCIRIDRKQLILLIFSTSFFLYSCRSLPFCFLHRQVCLSRDTLSSANVNTSLLISRSFTNLLPSHLHGPHWLPSSQWKFLQVLCIHYPFLLPLSIQESLTDCFPKSLGLRRASGSHCFAVACPEQDWAVVPYISPEGLCWKGKHLALQQSQVL